MTAAHCTDGASKVGVALGCHVMPCDDADSTIQESFDFFVHEEWNDISLHNDISLIRLPVPLDFSASSKLFSQIFEICYTF